MANQVQKQNKEKKKQMKLWGTRILVCLLALLFIVTGFLFLFVRLRICRGADDFSVRAAAETENCHEK